MDEPTKETLSQVITGLLTAFGLIIDPLVFVVALLASLGSAILVSRERPRAKRRPFWQALLGGLVFSVLSAMASSHFFPGLPVVLAMVLGGLSSSFILNIYVGIMTRIEERVEQLADRIIERVIPEKDSEK